MDSQSLGSKEIYLEERCLFALSLIPIAINICVKANLKKSINSVLQPILDSYQIKNTNCAVYLNSANYTLNLSELCATIDNQHVLVVHKHQSNRKSPVPSLLCPSRGRLVTSCLHLSSLKFYPKWRSRSS